MRVHTLTVGSGLLGILVLLSAQSRPDVEEHGPYLPAFTDGYASEWAAGQVAKAIVARPGWTVVTFPVVPLGVGSPEDFGGRRPFAGSYTVRPSTLEAVFRALLEASDYFHDTKGTRRWTCPDSTPQIPLTRARGSSACHTAAA